MGQLINNQVLADPGGARINFVADWKEKVGAISPGMGQFSRTSASEKLYVYVPWDTQYEWRQRILGYHRVVNDKLRRVLPARHPRETHMWAERITEVRGVRFDGKEVHVEQIQATAKYTKALLTVQFETPDYAVLEDNDVANEWERYVSRQREPKEDVILQNKGNMTFVEGTGSDGQPTAGTTQFPRTIVVIEAKTNLRVTWHEVPEEFVLDADGKYPALDNAAGSVNSAEFLGYPAGTLLFRPPRVERFRQTVNLRDPKAFNFLLKIELNLQFFDPPQGNGSAGIRGHNLKPWIDRQCYYATAEGAGGAAGTAGGNPTHPTYDHRKVFQHHSNA